MKKTLLIILFVISGAVHSEAEWLGRGVPAKTNVAIKAFGKKLVFPWACEIHTSGLKRNNIRFYCDTVTGLNGISIIFSNPEECAASEIQKLKNNSEPAWFEKQNKLVNGNLQFEVELKLKNARSTSHMRIIKSNKLCMRVISATPELISIATKLVWK